MLGFVTDPAGTAGITLRELPEPEPGPHDVVVEVAAYAVNRGELALIERRADGWAPGQDVAGVVVAAAADGTGPAVGTRVAGIADQGGWSERVPVPSHRTAALPDSVNFAAAAALPVAGLTALRALRTGGPLLGRQVLVTGASGGVGSFAVQLARAAGAVVSALVSSASRVDAVASLGAHQVLTELGDDAGPFDLVLDGVGGQVLTSAVRRLAPGGQVTAYGVAGGERSDLAFYDFGAAAPGGRLEGFFIYSTGEETFGADLALLSGLIADGTLTPQVGTPRGWQETPAAVEALRARQVTGKLVLVRG
ncbi:MAG TPA: zinc-binding dehydrogenase [Streptosporangiaceae bacterium]|jgi:NADPH:quinone reductase-like Zn-dependent oxidoreductase